jgi:O-antigen/teichoic acid export membrane protein
MRLVRPVARERPSSTAGDVQSGSSLVSLSSGVVSVVSYGCTLAMAHLLGAADYSVYAAGQMLLSIVGVASAALVPLPLAHAVSSGARGTSARAHAVAFACYVSAGLGVAAGLVAAAVTAAVAPGTVVVAVALSATTLPTVAPTWGWLVGGRRYGRFAVAAVGEAVVRFGVSVAAVLLGWGAGGALAGYAVGAVAASTLAVRHLRSELSWCPAVLVERWRWEETAGIAVTQLVISVVIGADVVLAALTSSADSQVAGYQALSTLAKGPVYVAAATAVVAFPLLRDVRTRDSALRATLRSFAVLAFPAAALLATLPPQLGAIVLPDRYTASLAKLPLLAAAGVGYATVSLLGTVLLAIGATARCRAGLLVATLLLPSATLLGWHLGSGVSGLAAGATAGALGAAGILLTLAGRELPAGTGQRAVRGLVALVVLVGVLCLVRPYPICWALLAGCVGVGVVGVLHRRRGGDDHGPGPENRESRPSHLAISNLDAA